MNGSLTYDQDMIQYISQGGRGSQINWGIGAGKGGWDPPPEDNKNNNGDNTWALLILALIGIAVLR
jgi:hypothetical protein